MINKPKKSYYMYIKLEFKEKKYITNYSIFRGMLATHTNALTQAGENNG